jgi:hypothetical protein
MCKSTDRLLEHVYFLHLQEYLDLEPGVTPLETHISTSDSQYSSMSRSCSSVSDDVISHTNSSSDSDKEEVS